MVIIKSIFRKIYRELYSIRNSGRIGKGTILEWPCLIDKKTCIGIYCTINRYTCITCASVGNYCSIGRNVLIGPGEHPQDAISTSTVFLTNAYNLLTQKRCDILNDVWVGSYAIIKRGVRIGNGAIIGANSVVTKDVPDFAVVAGVPSKIVRFRFNENQIQRITESKWWNYPPNEARKIIARLDQEFKLRNC